MKTAVYLLRTLPVVSVVMFLVAVSPAQSTSTITQSSAGPFGFTCGSNKQTITSLVGQLNPEGTDDYSTATAPAPYPNVGYYRLTISPTQGLLKIAAESNDVDTDTSGTELIRQFHAIEAELTKQYGKPTQQEDSLKPGSIWAGDNEWTLSYMKNQRTLASHWSFSTPNQCVTSIDLTAEVASQTAGAVLIVFDLKGYVPSPEKPGKKKNGSLENSR
jgi:hypothetical protein